MTYISPIWRDTYCILPYSEYHMYNKYRIVNTTDGKSDVLFEGKIFWLENKDANIKVNDFAQDVMNYDFEFPIHAKKNNSEVDIKVQLLNGNDWNDIDVFKFYYDYSFNETDNNKNSKTITFSNTFNPNTYFLFTTASNDNEIILTTVKTTDILGKVNPIIIDGGLNATTFSVSTKDIEQITVEIKYKNNLTESYVFNAEDTCSKYVLYYVNKYGGWETYNISGKVLPKQNITRNTYLSNADNNYKRNFATKSYLNTLKNQWQITTGYFDDEQSELFSQIYSSPIVYLHDIEKDEIIAVNITDKNVDIKQYSNQKKNPFFTYTLNVEASQDEIRK